MSATPRAPSHGWSMTFSTQARPASQIPWLGDAQDIDIRWVDFASKSPGLKDLQRPAHCQSLEAGVQGQWIRVTITALPGSVGAGRSDGAPGSMATSTVLFGSDTGVTQGSAKVAPKVSASLRTMPSHMPRDPYDSGHWFPPDSVHSMVVTPMSKSGF